MASEDVVFDVVDTVYFNIPFRKWEAFVYSERVLNKYNFATHLRGCKKKMCYHIWQGAKIPFAATLHCSSAWNLSAPAFHFLVFVENPIILRSSCCHEPFAWCLNGTTLALGILNKIVKKKTSGAQLVELFVLFYGGEQLSVSLRCSATERHCS